MIFDLAELRWDTKVMYPGNEGGDFVDADPTRSGNNIAVDDLLNELETLCDMIEEQYKKEILLLTVAKKTKALAPYIEEKTKEAYMLFGQKEMVRIIINSIEGQKVYFNTETGETEEENDNNGE